MDDFEKNAFLLWLSFFQLTGVMLFAERLAEPGLGEAVLVGCMSSQVLLHVAHAELREGSAEGVRLV